MSRSSHDALIVPGVLAESCKCRGCRGGSALRLSAASSWEHTRSLQGITMPTTRGRSRCSIAPVRLFLPRYLTLGFLCSCCACLARPEPACPLLPQGPYTRPRRDGCSARGVRRAGVPNCPFSGLQAWRKDHRPPCHVQRRPHDGEGSCSACYPPLQTISATCRKECFYFLPAFNSTSVLYSPSSSFPLLRHLLDTSLPLSLQVNLNLSGLPGCVVPCGFTQEGDARLPIGLQMIGKAFG